jgi:hypothetical protein
MRTILRPKDVYGRGNKPIPVGRTKFFTDYVEHDENDKCVPGTEIPRLKPVPLGERAIGFFSDKIEELQEALSKLCAAPSAKMKLTKTALPARTTHNKKTPLKGNTADDRNDAS